MKQRGQTLIETVVGIFILIMGISSAIGLASYAFGATSGVIKQLVGVGLAREAMEAVRNMRDTNWLQDSLRTNCWNYQPPGSLTANCYPDWLDQQYDLSEDAYTLDIDSNADDDEDYWRFNDESDDFRVYYDSTPTGSRGIYTTSSSGGNPFSGYYRKITLTHEDTSYTTGTIGPRLHVIVEVWWTDKGCGPYADNQTFPTRGKCGVRLDTYLTNWRNY